MQKFEYSKDNSIVSSGMKICKMKKNESYRLIQDSIESVFKSNEKIKNFKSFRSKLLKVQDLINKKEVHIQIINENKNFFLKLFKVKKLDELSVQSVVYFRGVRPYRKNKSEYIGYHRENFYNDFDYINHQINIHMPVKNYSINSSMKYLPKSHLINDGEFKFEKINSKKSGIKRFSTSHKIGLPYNPKKIISGVDIKKAKRLKLKVGEFVAFSSRLIHGGGENHTDKVRFSIDFGLIKKKIVIKKNKKFHFSSYHINKKHYVNIKFNHKKNEKRVALNS
tara:strand:+ start:599 stop:1438 length:840 start_codon:yes stop_codon:yes gene_type:complete